VGIVAVAILAFVAIVTTRRRPHTGTAPFDRAARHRDRSSGHRPPLARPRSHAGLDADRARVPVAEPRRTRELQRRPIDEDALGVTRRSFINRSLLAGMVLGIATFGSTTLAFLWPSPAKGFGSKITVGSTADAAAAFANKQPFYNATAKTYIVAYPKADIEKAKAVPAYTPPIIAGMEAGYVALYQTCPHLGCRVPWCPSSQWFECPCHGSKYNAVGEKQGGPAPRGMDRFVFTLSGTDIVVDTGSLVLTACG
jgi:cytochrome b6-f complex iron-sulfur subunit